MSTLDLEKIKAAAQEATLTNTGYDSFMDKVGGGETMLRLVAELEAQRTAVPPPEFWSLLHEWADSPDEERRDAIEARFAELFLIAKAQRIVVPIGPTAQQIRKCIIADVECESKCGPLICKNGKMASILNPLFQSPPAPELEMALLDWKFETKGPIAKFDEIYAEYSKNFDRHADAEMVASMQKVQKMLFTWWGWHYEAIRSALVQAQNPASEQDALDARRLDFVEAHPELFLNKRKNRWSFAGFTSYEYETYKTLREAIDAAMSAGEGEQT